jgi:pyruvate/2-oxoglutarate dehydrogenase complex dihydrolipoamide acyltransferase (E2) component
VTSSHTENGAGAALAEVTMPQMGVSVAEGTVVEWKVAVGDPVVAEEPICEISSDKIDSEVPAPVSGVLAEVLVAAGETVDVGTVLARIAPPGAELRSSGAPHGPQTTADPARPAGPRRFSPVVARIAAEHHVDLSQIIGTGRDGRVRKQDVLAFIAQGGAATPAPAPPEPPLHIESPYIPEPAPAAAPAAPAASADPAPAAGAAAAAPAGTLSRMRRQIGEHMKRSLETAATCTTWMEVDMGRVEAARRQARVGDLIGVTALPIVARATIEALHDFPALNATLDGERYEQHRAVHLGVAVSLGEERGLIVPVIRDAQELSVEGLAARIKDLARRARAGALTPDEVRGGTFTITNPGQYGAIMATPVINQPQVAILDLEAIVKRPIVVSDDEGNDMIAIRPQTILGLSWDHRALDGALAAQFLGAIRRRLERWES